MPGMRGRNGMVSTGGGEYAPEPSFSIAGMPDVSGTFAGHWYKRGGFPPDTFACAHPVLKASTLVWLENLQHRMIEITRD